MARKSTGQVIVRKRKDDRIYALRFRAYGKRHYITLGTDADGWSREKAQEELEHTLGLVRRNQWQPPRPVVIDDPETDDPTFHQFATEWFEAKKQEIRPNTQGSYLNDLTNHLLPYFKDYRLSQITIREVDRYREHKVREGKLKPGTINMGISLLAQILEVAVEYKLGGLTANPASGKRRRLKAEKRPPVYLDTVEHIEAMLEAASLLDQDRRVHTEGRRAALAIMLFAGLRAEEVGALLWRDVDIANGRLHVGRSKTSAGVREVDLLPILRDELLTLKASGKAGQDDHVFRTSTGSVRDRHNLRQRVVAPVAKRADELLAEQDARPLPSGLSPHKLRHTFASLLVALGNDPAYVMRQLGHTDPAFTLRVYTHMMNRDEGERERLRAVIDGRDLSMSRISEVRAEASS